MPNKTIVAAGGTGNLGCRIIKALLNKEVEVRVLVRSSSDKEKIAEMDKNSRSAFKLSKKSSIKIADDELRFRQK